MLEIHDLSFAYPGSEVPALRQVSLSIARGKILGLLGPNGAGKSTLMSLICGLLPLQQGRMSFDDTALPLRKSKPHLLSLAPQEFAFYPTLTLEENLIFFARLCQLPTWRARMAACVAFSQLEQVLHKRADTVSGGVKRRLNLAIALLPEPQILLLDEPTAGVDPQSRAFIITAIKALKERGTIVIYSSHYMEEIEAIADEVVVLNDGQVVTSGPLQNLLDMQATHQSLEQFFLGLTRRELRD